MTLADFPALAALPRDQKISLADELLDSAHAEALPPISEEFRAELDRRRAAHEADPSSAVSWDQVKAECAAWKKANDGA